MTIFLVMLIKILQQYLKTINFNLKATINNFDEESTENLIETLNMILNLRNKILELMTRFSTAFGLAVVGSFLYVVGIGTCECYFIYSEYLFRENDEVKDESYKIVYYWINISWTYPLLILQSMLGFNCVKTKDEADEVYLWLDTNLEHLSKDIADKVAIIPTLKCQRTNCAFQFKVYQVFRQALSKRSEFSAMGFFLINNSILYMVWKHLI